jgi:hypothetical protein
MDWMKSFLNAITGPPGLILVGAILGAIGALWAASQKAEFERELRIKNEEIAALNKKTFNAVTGGDSFCYFSLSLPNRASSIGRFFIVHQGDNALYDVTARLVNLDRFEEIKGEFTISSLKYTDTNITLGTLIARHASIGNEVKLDQFPSRGYNIFFSARNGSFSELLRLKKVQDKWKQAIQVTRDGKVIFEKVDDEYPRDSSGNFVW